MLIAALVVFVVGGPGDGQASAVASDLPQLSLVEPVNGATVAGPLRLVFSSGGERLMWMPTGWGVGGHHVHVEVNGVEVMPGPSDISPQSGDRYSWVVANAPLGELTVRLIWSDSRHRPVDGGGSDTRSIRLE